ncbi:MAG: hypothetical protein DRI46_06605 [Chloroflexi bacterium]|nr:MAG: hypothetical protein DRI46_06605 [Chloroflexota bacterium]
MALWTSIVGGALQGISSIVGQAITARGLKKESQRKKRLSDKLFAETENKPRYDITEGTQERLDYYKNRSQGPGARFGALGEQSDVDLSRRLSDLREGASTGAQLIAGSSAAAGRAEEGRIGAIDAGAQDIERANMGVDKYTAEVERANEINWGTKLGTTLRKEQMAYDYLGGAEQARIERLYSLGETVSSGVNWAGKTISSIGSVAGK